MTTEAAAQLAGYSAAHTRRLVAQWELGRHIGNGAWKVSRVAWRLFLDGDGEGLRAYHEGRCEHPRVAAAFAAIGASDLAGRRITTTAA